MKKNAPRGNSNYHVDPHLRVYGPQNATPEALQREFATRAQEYQPENILIWGDDNALPLRILQAINQSPTTISCLGAIENYIKGAGFTDPGLEELVIDKDGTTLWDLHCQLSAYLAVLDGFSLNFKYNENLKITNTYVLGIESNRFVSPGEGSKNIEYIKYNPYFGTDQYKMEHTQQFDVFNLDKIREQFRLHRADEKRLGPYKGQIYFCGSVRPPYKFYPIPKYWSGEEWIYTDANIKVFHKASLDNGFFQSVLMNVIGKPDEWSKDPSQMKEEVQTDGTIKRTPTKTNAMMFDEMMSATFSGARKANSIMALWSSSAENAVKINAFPTNQNFDVLSGTFTDTIRGITIATEVPAILANLPMSENSLGSDGKSMETAVEIMQSRTYAKRIKLIQFYNKILLPNLEAKGARSKEVDIKNYSPISKKFAVEDKVWEWLNDKEKASLIKKAMPEIELFRDENAEVVEPQIDPETGEAIPVKKPNENLKTLGLRDWDRIAGIKNRFKAGKMSQPEVEAALLSYGFTKEEIDEWLQSNVSTV